IGVPRTSFKATDIIIMANPVRTAAGLRKQRRVLQITEVRKEWEEDPLREGAFVDLLKYNPTTDELELTDNLKNGDSDVLKTIAANIKDFAGNWDAVWENIQLRADVKQEIINIAMKSKNDDLLEAEFVTKSNDIFHMVIDKVKEELGELDSKRILFEFKEWLKREAKARKKA
ncbi:hypothetical protein HY497_00170, partial [Candidatus Woesearchaeota archaeon]|nr:hypothetical protein [Candidatus Woesearchaeota archaeon]